MELESLVSQTVSELLDAWNAHDVERLQLLYAGDYSGVDIGRALPQQGPHGIRTAAVDYLRAFPDLRFEMERPVVQGNEAIVTWTAHGTHNGELMHIPATGRRVSVRGVSVLTIEGGKVRRGEYIWDVAGMLRSIGLLPDLQ
jgi:steroid delta-isomerase-like uncharacterized protein